MEDLERLMPNFKIASAIIDLDEASLHLHIVGVPIKDGEKMVCLNKLLNQMYLQKIP